MKTLNGYEIVDEAARKRITSLGRSVTENANMILSLQYTLGWGDIQKEIGTLTEKWQQTGGSALMGLNIIDNSLATVNKISGNSVFIGTELKNAQISGIKSCGRNLLNVDNMVRDNFVKNDDGSYTLTKIANPENDSSIGAGDGFSNMTGYAGLSLPAGTYTFSFDVIETNYDDVLIGCTVYLVDGTTKTYKFDAGTPLIRTFETDIKDFRLKIQGTTYDSPPIGTYATIKNIMVNFGSGKSNYRAYTESEMILPETIELGVWDYIIDGQIVRHTRKYTFTGEEPYVDYIEGYDGVSVQFCDKTETQFFASSDITTLKHNNIYENRIKRDCYYEIGFREISQLFNTAEEFMQFLKDMYAKGTPVVVLYKLKTPIIENISFNNQYRVWNKGLEQVLTPKDESGLTCFDYGVKTKEENEYIVISGGDE